MPERQPKKKQAKGHTPPKHMPGKRDPLLQIVVDNAAFFALCDDETLDPNIACKHLEWISHMLRQLEKTRVHDLEEFVSQLADQHEAEGEDAERGEFLRSFMEDVYLVEEE